MERVWKSLKLIVCKMTLGNWDNDTKNISHLENSEQGLNEGLSIKGEIDIYEIPFENQVSEEFWLQWHLS